MKRNILHHPSGKVYQLFSFVLCLTVCCAVHVTPAFSQGTLVAKKLGSTASPFGYYEYLPTTYSQKNKHPVIIFLSGNGEKGNGTTELDRVLKHGPPKLIKNGTWPSSRPFMVFAPQGSNSFIPPDDLHDFISYIIKTYKADPARIYLTGLSAGGVSVWKYLKRYQDQIAAAIPISGNGRSPADKACEFKHIPIWAFHGSNDGRVSMTESIYPVEKVNACVPKPDPLAKVTIYPGVGHDAWTRTYDLSGMNSNTDSRYDPYNKNIYDWMLLYARDGSAPPPPPTNQLPVADAGEDISVTQSTTKVVLNGSDSHDSDGNIVAYAWTKVSGPSASLSGAGSSQLAVTNLSEGTYNFKLTVEDDDGATDSDNVVVSVESTTTSSNGVSYQYYEGSWSKLPDFSRLKVVKSGEVSNFNLSARNRNDNFGFRFDSYIEITEAGEYTFYTDSDDGSRLFINGKLVVNNDGLHGNQERSGKITLPTGYHAMKVKFFERTGGETLAVKYAGPGFSKKSIPNARLHTKKPSDPSPSPSPGEEGVTFTYYEGSWNKLPDFSRLNVVKSGKVSNFNLSARNRNDNFGFRFDSYIEITKAGEYTFYTASDDGSQLFINGKLVVNNDGLHGNQERSGKITLPTGYHAMKVKFFERTQGETLAVKYAGPGIGKQNIPNSKLFISNGNNAKVANNTRIKTVAEKTIFEKPVNEKPQIVSIYPNPVEDKIHIRFAPGEVGEVSCKLLNYTGAGHKVSIENAQHTDGSLVIDVSQWNLSAGVYLLQVTYNQAQQVFRIIKK